MGNNFNSKNYWETRYKGKGNSGAGSYGVEADFKSKYINTIINDNNIKTINDFGSGDSNQIGLITGFDKYTGFDVSATALTICRNKFKDNDKYDFVSSVSDMTIADMTISLDVTYHIIEDEYFNEYMHNLFNLTNEYVLIYSVNNDNNKKSAIHLKHRKFVDWVKEHYPEFKLIDTSYFTKDNGVGFFLFKK